MKKSSVQFYQNYLDNLIPDSFKVKPFLLKSWPNFLPYSLQRRVGNSLQELDEIRSIFGRSITPEEIPELHFDVARQLLVKYGCYTYNNLQNQKPKALERKFHSEFSLHYKLKRLVSDLDRAEQRGWHNRVRHLTLVYESTIQDMITQQDSLLLSLRGGSGRYRSLATFHLNPANLKLVKGYDRLQRLGWFSRENNPSGLVKDHRYSIADGIRNRIPPNILGHPANCELLTEKENIAKLDNSSLSYDELLLAIRMFEADMRQQAAT